MKILLCLLLFFQTSDLSQDSAKSLEKELGKSLGIEKLKNLNQLTGYYLHRNERKAFKYGEQAVEEANKLFDNKDYPIAQHKLRLRVTAYNQLGKVQYFRKYYFDAQKSFNKGLTESKLISDEYGRKTASLYLAKIDSIAENSKEIGTRSLKKSTKSTNLAEKISQSSLNLKVSTNIKIAQAYERKGNSEKAIHHYKKAAEKSTALENRIAINKHIATLYEKEGKYEEALAHYQQLIEEEELQNDTLGMEKSMANIKEKLEINPQPEEVIIQGFQNAADSINLGNFKLLAEEFEEKQDYASSLEYYKKYMALNEKLKGQIRKQKIDSLEIRSNVQEITLLKQQKQIQELDLLKKNTTITAQNEARRNLLIGTLLLAGFLIAVYLLYTSKKKAYGQLETTYNDLSVTKDKLVNAEQKIRTLLKQQVSGAIAETLLSEKKAGKVERKFVCIMFLDIRGFTPFAENRTPEEIIKYQNDVFGFMIDIISKENGIINQFLGDGFMATFGAPISHGNDCQNAFVAAKKIIEEVNQKSADGSIHKTRVGVGLHAGNVVAGNVGTKVRKQYSITGNTVITAARIEQLNKKFDSQLLISKEVYTQLDNTNGLSADFIEEAIKGRTDPVKLLKVV